MDRREPHTGNGVRTEVATSRRRRRKVRPSEPSALERTRPGRCTERRIVSGRLQTGNGEQLKLRHGAPQGTPARGGPRGRHRASWTVSASEKVPQGQVTAAPNAVADYRTRSGGRCASRSRAARRESRRGRSVGANAAATSDVWTGNPASAAQKRPFPKGAETSSCGLPQGSQGASPSRHKRQGPVHGSTAFGGQTRLQAPH